MVYFDQFGYLSTLHLLLVILGIVILLTGVWIVSFPPGGQPGGIDIGIWGEESECDTESHLADETASHYEDEPLSMDSSRIPPNETIGMGRVSSQDSNSRTQDDTTPRSPTSRTAHLRRQTEPVLLSPTQQADDLPESPISPTHRRSLAPQGTLGHHHHLTTSRQSFPPHPLSPGAPSGFSIGLSPVSPGFALVPRERGRRKRVSSVEGDPHLERGTFRRVLSEGSVAAGISRESRVEGDEQIASPRTEQEIEASGLQVGGDRSRARWRWLSNLFTSRKKQPTP